MRKSHGNPSNSIENWAKRLRKHKTGTDFSVPVQSDLRTDDRSTARPAKGRKSSWERPISIIDDFPSLTLEQAYGAIAFYLAHQEEIDAYLRREATEYEALRQKHLEQLRVTKPQLYRKLTDHKQRQGVSESTPELIEP